MKFYRLKEVEQIPCEHVFRQSSLSIGVGFFIMLGPTLVLSYFAYTVPLPWYVWIFVVFLLLFAWLYFVSFNATFKRSNWLLKVSPRGLFIQFRSYLNHHYSADDETVVQLDFDEVRSVGSVVDETILHRDKGSLSHTKFIYLDIVLNHPQTDRLKELLANERNYQNKGVVSYANHFPVRLQAPDILRLAWYGPSDRIKPDLNTTLKILEKRFDSHGQQSQTFNTNTDHNNQEIENRILDLIEAGQDRIAIHLIRHYYKYSITEAKRFMDELRGNGYPNAQV